MVFGGRFRIRRCNSKASSLPRQSLEKLNNSDPDHGSYKLTLTSNEDLVANAKPTYEIFSHNGKISNNLPDVLPLGVKLQPQPASPTSSNSGTSGCSSSSPLRYGSNNNLASNTHQHPHQQQQQQSSLSSYPMYPSQHRYSTPTVSSYNNTSSSNNNIAHIPAYSRSQSYDVNTHTKSPTKFMSQSTIDLKKTHNLETTLEEETIIPETATKLLSPAQSENNLVSSCTAAATASAAALNSKTKRNTLATKPLSPCSAKREFHRSDMLSNKMPADERAEAGDGKIFRAELVNATLSTSPCGTHKTLTRKDSLRENIEKITQLQSKLMSAHLSDSSSTLLTSYGSKSVSALNQLATPSNKLNSTSEHDKQTIANHSKRSDTATVTEVKIDCDTTKEESNAVTTAKAVSLISSNNKQSTNRADSVVQIEAPLLAPTTAAVAAAAAAQKPKTEDKLNISDKVILTQIAQMDSSTDGLKLMQRSEIILHVNPTTVETASQTDDLQDSDMGRLTVAHNHSKEDPQTSSTHTTLQPRERHPIEIECDNLSMELASLLTPNDKLLDILVPQIVKSPTDYVSNLYNPNVPLRPTKRDVGTSTLMRMKTSGELQETNTLLITTVELQYADIEVTLANGNETDGCDPMKKKVDELIKQLSRKLRIFNSEHKTINEESAINDELGNQLIGKLAEKVRPIEATKLRTYIDDVGHITSLLLSLSERLAKAENSLCVMTAENNTEKKTIESKRDRLYEQLEEAQRLRADIDRRGSSVTAVLEKHLSVEEFADFDYFINMKAKLIADSRDIADKIKCGKEKLDALNEALIQSDC